MKTALLLITGLGLAPYEVADLLRPRDLERPRTLTACPCGCGTGVIPGEHCALIGWEVRDFEAVPRRLAALAAVLHHYDGRVSGMAEAICREDGGTEWLVGRVLPDARESYCHTPYNHPYPQWDCAECRGYTAPRMAAKLAILAPAAPQLLRDRVVAWGGSVWKCGEYSAMPDRPCSIGKACYATYREAVLAALGVSDG